MKGLKRSEKNMVHVGATETAGLDQYSSGWIQLSPPLLVNGLVCSETFLVDVGTTETIELAYIPCTGACRNNSQSADNNRKHRLAFLIEHVATCTHGYTARRPK